MGNSGAGWLLSLILPAPKEKVRGVSPSSQNRGLNPLSPAVSDLHRCAPLLLFIQTGQQAPRKEKAHRLSHFPVFKSLKTDQRSGRRTPATN